MTAFHERLLAWWAIHGRHDLPWQRDRTPYRVWVSEIMLQQTQVSTVIPYFNRFMQRFPDLQTLANASLDDVLSHWTGLGYYARARNLHKTACLCWKEHQGQLPDDVHALQELPGIGRSTAHAIVAQSSNRRAPILDGNVKRVLTRHQAIDGWPGQASIQKTLWQIADDYTPRTDAADYTQAMMDLGATVCTRSKPRCDICPVASDCRARLQGLTGSLPSPKPKLEKKHIRLHFNVLLNTSRQVFLEKRPDRGIWGGLWCYPLADADQAIAAHTTGPTLDPIEHLLTHRVLQIRFSTHVLGTDHQAPQGRWFSLEEASALGLPQPIRVTLEALKKSLQC